MTLSMRVGHLIPPTHFKSRLNTPVWGSLRSPNYVHTTSRLTGYLPVQIMKGSGPSLFGRNWLDTNEDILLDEGCQEESCLISG